MADEQAKVPEGETFMNRRTFFKAGLGAAGMVAISTLVSSSMAEESTKPATKETFKLKYAPHFGMFQHHAGRDLIDQLKFISVVIFHYLLDGFDVIESVLHGEYGCVFLSIGLSCCAAFLVS